VLTIDPKYNPALFNLAILTDAAGDPTAAADLYRRAAAANPSDASSHFNLGLLLLRLGKTAQGNAEITKAIKLNPALKRPSPATTK
jgi:Tfp pilus assembly protein PilF